ncbi:MAG: T9SS type A sorting domain-containing protein, partial [Bacteroidota bacterium]
AVDTFQEVVLSVTIPPVSSFAGDIYDVIDFDQDGDEDIITSRYILLNEGDGDFSTVDLFLEVGSGFNEFVIGVADFNGDNQLDILIHREEFFDDEPISVLTNNGDNTFTKCVIYEEGDAIGNTELADIDQDGDIDIVMGSGAGDDDILLFKNNGECDFTLSLLNYSGFPNFSERSIEVQDMNGDGKPEILAIGFNLLYIFENTDGFATEANYDFIEIGQNVFFKVADLNNDNRPDIAVVTREGNFRVEFFENKGNMFFEDTQSPILFSPAPGFGTPPPNYLEKNMYFYDYDKNGALDIIYTNGFGIILGNNNVTLVLNTTDIVNTDNVVDNVSAFNIFPNPVSNEVVLPLSDLNIDGTIAAEVINMQGQSVKRVQITSTNMDVSDLAKGQYIFLLKTASKIYRSHFIKM